MDAAGLREAILRKARESCAVKEAFFREHAGRVAACAAAMADAFARGISTSGKSANVNRALQGAREMGLLTVGFSGRDGGRMPALCDHCFTVTSFSIHRIQETQETLLHVLWDAVHVIRGEEDVI